MESNEHNNFFLGFVVGALTGVSGYFLTKTKEGQELKEKFVSQWSKLRARLEEEGVISKNEQEIIAVISKCKTHLAKMVNEQETKKIVKKQSRKRGRPKKKVEKKLKKKKNRFKGV